MSVKATLGQVWATARGPTRQADPYVWRQVGYWRWFVIIVISLIAGLASGYRWLGWGRDYYDYLLAYANVDPGFSLSYSRFEPAYNALSWLFKIVLGLEYEPFATVLVAVGLAMKLYLIHRYLRYAWLATIVYFLFLYPLHDYTQIRISLGIAFGFWAMQFVLSRRWLMALVALALSVLFHYTMLVFIVGLAAALVLPNRKWVIAGTIAGLVTLSLSESLLSFVTLFAGWFNPLADVYTNQVARGLLIQDVNIFSAFNLFLYGALIASVMYSWFDTDRYRRVNALLAATSVLVMLLFLTLPTFAHRLREVFMFAFILFAFRDARREMEFAPAVFVFLASLVTFIAAIQDEVIVFG
jgi:hypothetical protein